MIDESKPHTVLNHIYDFLGSTESILADGVGKDIELDYSWDWKTDPIITPTIVNEWRHLDHLLGRKVLRGASKVVSVGGGGTSQTHKYLDPKTKEFYIVNPGIWDLAHAGMPNENTKTFLVRAIAEELPIKNSSTDAIEIPATLDHVVNPKKVIEECFRILTASGKIGITLGNENSWYRTVVRKFRLRTTDHHAHAHNFHFSTQAVEELLRSEGFVNVQTIGTAYLKLPKFFERRMGSRSILLVHHLISNYLLRFILGDRRGGMFLTLGEKP